MTEKSITDAQDYLIIDYGGRMKRILDITTLLQSHPTEAVILFMKSLLREKQKVMRDYLVKDKTNPCLDEVIATIFRIGMAITVLENESEVTIKHEAQQGATSCGELSGGNGNMPCSSR